LSQEQITQLQSSLKAEAAKSPSLDSQAVLTQIKGLAQAGITYKPGMPTSGLTNDKGQAITLTADQVKTIENLNKIHTDNFIRDIADKGLTSISKLQNEVSDLQDRL